MNALTFRGICNIVYEEIPDPLIRDPGDAIVKIEYSALCGSDMHVYHGRETGLDTGTVMGHEFVGEIEETGKAVTGLKPGDKVASPFTTSCGECYFCRSGLTARCSSGELFGWIEKGKGLHGGQATLVRVPMADATLVKYPPQVSSRQALLSGDILSTAYFCAEMAGIRPGKAYGVVGCGPVGLLTIMCALEQGAGRVYAIDSIPARLKMAGELGAIAVDLAEDPAAFIREETGNRGLEAVMEAVGSKDAQRLAYDIVRAGGIISAVGVNTSIDFAFTPADAYNKNISFRTGRCPARHYMDIVLPKLAAGRLDPERIISHVLPLSEGPRAYAMFDRKEDDCLKILLAAD